MPAPFAHRQAIRFAHCDPGGIVYFPHFFEMAYEAVEDWFDSTIEPGLEWRLRRSGLGFPTVNTACDFFIPSRAGDVLELEVVPQRIGRSSVEFAIAGRGDGGAERLRFRHLLALVSLDSTRAVELPADLRGAIAAQIAGGGAPALGRLPPAGSRARGFTREHLIRFSHCDPGGIVHFPRYFDFVNAIVEDWFADELGLAFDAMHMTHRLGVPIVHTQCEFLKPCRIGERLTMDLAVTRIGRTSLELSLTGRSAGEERLRARNTRALISLDTLRPTAIPEALRASIAPFATG